VGGTNDFIVPPPIPVRFLPIAIFPCYLAMTVGELFQFFLLEKI
jgi:hypothetical protein